MKETAGEQVLFAKRRYLQTEIPKESEQNGHVAQFASVTETTMYKQNLAMFRFINSKDNSH